MKRPIAALALLLATAAAPVSRPPNIVVFLADDWGFTDVGSYGGEIATPNIDALAAKGVRFSNFHVAGSCSPTRAMLQTGVDNHLAGVGNMLETIPPEHLGRPGYLAELNGRVATLADRLRAEGYRTYLTGKWHLGHKPDKLPTAHGYDHAFALGQSGADNFEEKPNLLLYRSVEWTEDGRPAHLPKDFYSSRFIVDKMIDYVDAGRPGGKPFFASLNFLANHIPVQAPDADIAAYAERYSAGWTALRAARRDGAIAKGVMPPGMAMVTMASTGDWAALSPAEKFQRARAMEAYGGMAQAMDREIGRFVADLKAHGDYDNTVFVFLSDNGGEALDPMAATRNRLVTEYFYDTAPAHQGQRGTLTAIGTSFASAVSSPLKGYKFSASEGGLRVPLVIAWPGNPAIAAGRVVPAFAHVTDIAPTLLAAAGLPRGGGRFGARAVEPMTGFDLTPLLTGAAAAVHPADAPLGYELSGNSALFKGDWKFVRNLPPYGDGRWHLFDIAHDPGEAHDRAAAEPGRVRAMAADYAAFARRAAVLPMPAGYSAPRQVERNALADRVLKPLRGSLPWLAAALAAAVVFAVRRGQVRKIGQRS
jgi:arylsulfatase/uncharacterized sulfatase